jgi:hypothetical protein
VDRPKGDVAHMVRHDLPHTLLGPIEFISAYLPVGIGTHLKIFLTIRTTFFVSHLSEIAFSFVVISIPDIHILGLLHSQSGR